MIFFCVSLPGRFGEWCDTVIARVAQAALGSVVSAGANTAEELAGELVRSGGQHFYIGARHPSRWWREMLTATGKKFVVAVDDPRRGAADLILRHKLELRDASRLVACSCAFVCRYSSLPGALVVSSERASRSPNATVAALAEHLELSVDTDTIDRIIAELEASGLVPVDPDAAESARLSDESLPTVNGALAPFSDYFASGTLGPIIWSRNLFLEENHGPAIHPINISGKIRYLVHGPHIALPPGSWMAEVILGFSEDAIGMGFRIEVWAGSQLGMAQITPSGPGLARVNVNFVLEESNDSLVEIRVMNERAAIYGQLILGQVTMTLLPNVSPAVVDRLTAELGLPSERVRYLNTV